MSAREGPRQLALALSHRESFAREDFLAGASNAAALDMVERWPDWPDCTLALIGPAGCGKSHLASIWAERAGARRVSCRALAEAGCRAALATGALVLEDVRAGELDEPALFHLLNLVREERAFLLLTSRTPPITWPVHIADLASRLRALPVVELGAADDTLVRAILVKLFADRQLAVPESVVAHMIRSLERSPEAIRDFIARADAAALAAKRPINTSLINDLLSDRAL